MKQISIQTSAYITHDKQIFYNEKDAIAYEVKHNLHGILYALVTFKNSYGVEYKMYVAYQINHTESKYILLQYLINELKTNNFIFENIDIVEYHNAVNQHNDNCGSEITKLFLYLFPTPNSQQILTTTKTKIDLPNKYIVTSSVNSDYLKDNFKNVTNIEEAISNLYYNIYEHLIEPYKPEPLTYLDDPQVGLVDSKFVEHVSNGIEKLDVAEKTWLSGLSEREKNFRRSTYMFVPPPENENFYVKSEINNEFYDSLPDVPGAPGVKEINPVDFDLIMKGIPNPEVVKDYVVDEDINFVKNKMLEEKIELLNNAINEKFNEEKKEILARIS